MALGFDSTSNRNKYQEYFLGVKAAGTLGRQLYHIRVPIVLKSGSLSLLETSGPVQACNGTLPPVQQKKTRLLYAASAASDVNHL
jgi:hypothetical protein